MSTQESKHESSMPPHDESYRSISAASSEPSQTNDVSQGTALEATDYTFSSSGGKNISVVWSHFEKKIINGVEKAQCIYCGRQLCGSSSNGTSHLYGHFKRCPRRNMLDMRPMCREKGTLTYSIYDLRNAREELVSMIIKHEYPLSMVDHIGFKRFSNSLQPLFKVPCRNTIKGDILKRYKYERDVIMKLLVKNDSRVAISANMWTSSHPNKGFMAIAAHFIDSSWVLQNRLLRFAYVPYPHRKEVLCNLLMETLLDWNLDTKISTLTVNNGSSDDGMIELIFDKLQHNTLLMGGKMLHMCCCAHILNLIVKDGLDIIKDGIERIRESVAYWSATPKRQDKFEETLNQMGISFTKKLSLDCATGWNSTYLMLETALLYKDVFPRLKQHDNQYRSLPSDDHWNFAREVCNRLQVFYSAIELFSSTKYPTANVYFPKMCELKVALNEWCTCSIEMIKEMAEKMLVKFNKYWDLIHSVLGIAAVLDPQYKMALLEFYFPRVYGNDYELQLEQIRHLCYSLVNDYNSMLTTKNGDATLGTFSQSNVASIGSARMSEYDKYVMQKRRKTSNAKIELDRYLYEDVLPRTKNFDILSWWKLNGVKFPTLKFIARDFLAIPVSTVASEFAFSTGGRVVKPHRSKLNPNTVEALMCTQNWLWTAERKGGASLTLDSYPTMFDDIDEDLPRESGCKRDVVDWMDNA